LETILNTNEFYKHKGKGPNEKSAQSPNVIPKTATSQSSAPTAHPSRKVINNNSGRGEKNPPSGKIESSYKLPLRKKRENVVQEEEYQFIESDINIFSLEDMELEEDIEKMFPNINQSKIIAH
jgi:hypothetical protein